MSDDIPTHGELYVHALKTIERLREENERLKWECKARKALCDAYRLRRNPPAWALDCLAELRKERRMRDE